MDVRGSTRTNADKHLLTVLFCIGLISHIDRSNVSFAALEMNQDLGISTTGYGLAAGVFFIGYAFGGLPHAAILNRFASHRWLAGMVGLWGLSCVALAFTPNESVYVLLRFLLGIGEAAFIPAAYTCLGRFYIRQDLPSPMAKLASASTVAFLVGAPLAAGLMQIDWLGLVGWQWMFILQGVPALLLAPFVPRLVPYSPAEAAWLSTEQRTWLAGALRAEEEERTSRAPSPSGGAFAAVARRPVTWILATVYFCLNLGFWGLLFFLPQIIKGGYSGASSSAVALISSIPYVVALVAMLVVGRTSARSGDQRWHIVALLAGSAVAMVGALNAVEPALKLAALTVGIALALACVGIYHSVTAPAFPDDLRAMGVAMVNGLGLLGGFVGPYLFGVLTSTVGPSAGFHLFAGAFGIGSLIVLLRPASYPGATTPTSTTEEPEYR